MTKSDLIVIGAGPGGYRAAEYAARQGLKVTIFEQADCGGTCLNVGCIPTKTYVHAATLAEARQRMLEVVPLLRGGVEQRLQHPNITLVRARAAFVDAHTVSPLSGGTGGMAAGAAVSAPHVIVATGSSPRLLPLPDIGDPRVVTSTQLLQQEQVPRRLCIVGAGVIGMELASVFRRFGAEVTVVEYLKECLPMLDGDIAKRLRKLLEKRGIVFRMKTAVTTVADLDADLVLMATGRRPNVSADFAHAGFRYDERSGIEVDDNYETTVKGVYAVGDVNGRQMLAHAAEMQAVRAVNHILGRSDGIRFDVMPAAIFTTPEAACVGPAEDQLKASGTPYTCHKSYWRGNGKAQAMGATDGMLKLFADGAGRLIGCHAYGAHASDIVQEVAALMCRDTTVGQLRDIIHIHPTLSEVLIQ